MTTTIAGRLFIHSETGTEGGYWAIQDKNFITPPAENPSNKICKTCHRYWQDAENTPEPPPSFTYYRPDWSEDGKNYLGGYYTSDVPIEGGQTTYKDEPEGSFNDEWTKRGNATSLKCYEGSHDWEWETPYEQWSYEGLNYIQDGDYITVFDAEDESSPIFEGTVRLVQQPDQYAPDAKYAGGLVIHSYPHPEFCEHEQWCKYFSRDYLGVITR